MFTFSRIQSTSRLARLFMVMGLCGVPLISSACANTKDTWVLNDPSLIASLSASSSSHPPFRVHSDAFADGAFIPQEFAYNSAGGANHSPDLHWDSVPYAKSYAVSVVDADARMGAGKIHWLVVNIPTSITTLEVNASDGHVFKPAKQIPPAPDADAFYQGPFPPENSMHHYIFTVYALKVAFIPKLNSLKQSQVLNEIHRYAMASTSIIGKFSNPPESAISHK